MQDMHNLIAKAKALQPRLVELRRTIHRRPELGFEVHETAALVARTLRELGIEAQTGVGKTGIVGHLGDGAGPVVALRADMDALPIHELNAVDYASTVAGQMHACGHDAHTTMLLGAAMLLAGEKLSGQARFIFQPCEETSDDEGISGAPRMVADGALSGVNSVIALHVDGTLETGQIGIESGMVLAAVDSFNAVVRGRGGHGAHPDTANDPIWLATQVLNALYAVPSRRIDPLQPCVLSLGVIRGGHASNIIPAEVYLEGTLRSMDPGVREQLLLEVERCLQVARALGGDFTLKIERGYPPLHNHAGVADEIRASAYDLLGAAGLGAAQPSMGAEDFAYMTQQCDGAMFRLGVKPPGAAARHLHTADFNLDEDALPLGAAMLAATAMRLMARGFK